MLAYDMASASNDHARQITLVIERVLQQAELHLDQFSAIAISSGPGSYTGLRVAASASKGICYALDIPLIAINTLISLAHAAEQQTSEEAVYVPMMDARRMEVYTAVYDAQLKPVIVPHARIMDENSLQELVGGFDVPIIICGSGSHKCKHLFNSDNMLYREDLINNAKNLIRPAYQAYCNDVFEDAAYFKPFYLKAPNITTPKPILK